MKLREGENYLKQYPEFRKWINHCTLCGRQGYRPEMRDEDFHHAGAGAYNIRRLFTPLKVAQSGLCEECEESTNK